MQKISNSNTENTIVNKLTNQYFRKLEIQKITASKNPENQNPENQNFKTFKKFRKVAK